MLFIGHFIWKLTQIGATFLISLSTKMPKKKWVSNCKIRHSLCNNVVNNFKNYVIFILKFQNYIKVTVYLLKFLLF